MRLSKSICSVVGEVIASTGSHPTLDALFISAGAPGEPPALSHHSKWKEWLFRTGQDTNVDSLAVLGGVLEEFMDLAPKLGTSEYAEWKERRNRVEAALEENGLRYFRFGRVLPQGTSVEDNASQVRERASSAPAKPARVEELLEIIVRGLRRAMHPLTHRRKGVQPLA
ncbi:MAG: transposase, partial [Gammaproteobacteria bacterium]